jgi:intracellular sulfur oxidation DsrE/DsrF family protein
MKNTLYLFIFINTLFIIVCCKNSDAQQSQNKQTIGNPNLVNNYDDLAKEYCECSVEIIMLNKKMQKLSEEGKFDEMGDLLSEIESKSVQQNACQEKLEAQFNIKIDTSKAVLLAIKRLCPDLGGFMENSKKVAD